MEHLLQDAGSIPKNMALYNKIKKRIYAEQPKHSLYRSAKIAKEYKEAGGEYIEDKSHTGMNIPLWFKQKWISLNDFVRDGSIKPCGSTNTQDLYGEYPLCRPLKIAQALTKKDIKKMIREKNKLKNKPLLTKKVVGTDMYNIKATQSGMKKTKNTTSDKKFDKKIYKDIVECKKLLCKNK